MRIFNKLLVTVFTDESGHNRLMMPSGEVVFHEIKSVVVDEINKPSMCEITALCNIVSTKKEALENYKK